MADSLRAYWGGRPLPVSSLTTPRLTDLGVEAYPEVTRRVWVGQGVEQMPRFYFHSGADTSQWVSTQLEPVGAEFRAHDQLTVDTVGLGPGQPLGLLVQAAGAQRFWGGQVDYQFVELLTLEPQPRLLLKSETSWTNTSYGRRSEGEFDDDAAGEERREQTIQVQSGTIRVGPVRVVERLGAERTAQTLRTVPMTMVPPGCYRYQAGQLVRIGR
ncbi:hypothetical protein [Hymenobacter yonginensis]|uniref:Uncharacterized protein n=1 Tax=Hymenobacter yonginensis TaxID=748197 RepID=A0ABY7PTK0_9BACT|nr:hypothetical protein [Hymenobacter yonginensis]WBO86237.1 hypothetical protein O9Z63_08240 [Hymenobacter yonginensis]